MKTSVARKGLLSSALFLAATLLLPADAIAAGDPPVKQLGRTVMRYRDGLIQVVIGYRYSSNNLKEPWLMLDTRIAAMTGESVSIHREDVSLELPDGRQLPMPSQKKVIEEFRDIERFVNAARPSREPLNGYFVSPRYEEKMRFFAIPGQDVVRDEVWATYTYLLVGDLFFKAPAGSFPSGNYALLIKNRKVDVRLPFRLPGVDLGNEAKGDKTIPW